MMAIAHGDINAFPNYQFACKKRVKTIKHIVDPVRCGLLHVALSGRSSVDKQDNDQQSHISKLIGFKKSTPMPH